jgi:hypothetical protein
MPQKIRCLMVKTPHDKRSYSLLLESECPAFRFLSGQYHPIEFRPIQQEVFRPEFRVSGPSWKRNPFRKTQVFRRGLPTQLTFESKTSMEARVKILMPESLVFRTIVKVGSTGTTNFRPIMDRNNPFKSIKGYIHIQNGWKDNLEERVVLNLVSGIPGIMHYFFMAPNMRAKLVDRSKSDTLE